MMKVAVVVLNYKSRENTLSCIKSVKRSDYKELLIIVVDNNSKDGIEKDIRNIEDVFIIQNDENLGYTGGNNIGIKKALDEGCEFVFILNPDTEIKKDAISKLVDGVLRRKAGIVNPKIYFKDSKKIWFAGKTFDKDNVLAFHRGVDMEDYGQFDDEMEIEDATGAAMMVRSEVFEKIGFFDDDYFLYYEESDFVTRAKLAGFSVWYIPDAVVYHENAKSTGLGSPLQDYFITRNRMIYASKFLTFRTRFALIREALRNLANPARRLALYDYLMGKFGKGSFLK